MQIYIKKTKPSCKFNSKKGLTIVGSVFVIGVVMLTAFYIKHSLDTVR